MLPNENILDMLCCADYQTLVLAKLAHAHFLHFISKYAEELAHRRRFAVHLDNSEIRYQEEMIPRSPAERVLAFLVRWKKIPYEAGSQEALAAACREVAGVIGPHAVVQLIFSQHTWNSRDVGVVFAAAPPLKYAECVDLLSPNGSAIRRGDSDVFMSHLAGGMKELSLRSDCEGFCHFDWTFLRGECARELRLFRCSAFMPQLWAEDMNRCIEELVRLCVTLPRLRGGEALQLDFTNSTFPAACGRRIIELLKDTECELTFRMSTRSNDMLVLDEADYTFDVVSATTTRYTCEESGIGVEVNGPWVTIKSTAVVPRKKPRTSGEVQPFVEQ